METKCICGKELEHGKSLCYVCETLALLSPIGCEKYLEIKRKCECVKNINDIKDKRQANNQSK